MDGKGGAAPAAGAAGKPKDTRIKTADVTSTEGYEFEDFGLKRELLMGIFEKGFEKPSPIQEQAIPTILQGRNVLARAKNGTGKTGSFCIPMLERVLPDKKHVQGLVLVPSRELALQTVHVLKELGKHISGLQVMSLVGGGGSNTRDDVLRLKQGVHIIVATPGKIMDMADRGQADLKKCGMVALDEADKLLSDRMAEEVNELLRRHLPPGEKRQLMLFSATYPAMVQDFVRTAMPGHLAPHQINLMDELTLKGITQFYAFVEEKQKLACLYTLLKKLEINQSMIFCNTVARVELLAKRISEMGMSCFYIHSHMDQVDRNRVFHEFRSGNARHLVASDLITRGIDVPTVNVVINFDFPGTAETYLHRIGRAGRYGHLGLSINLITRENTDQLYRIEQELQTEIKPIPPSVDRKLYCV